MLFKYWIYDDRVQRGEGDSDGKEEGGAKKEEEKTILETGFKLIGVRACLMDEHRAEGDILVD